MTREEFLKQCAPTVVGKQLWKQCAGCKQMVRLNKPIIGSLHFCTEDHHAVR